MAQPLSKESIQQIFTEARTHHAWTSKPVSEETLHALYDIAKFGPTSANSTPARFAFVRSSAAKEKLYPALIDGNVAQVRAAPVTIIVAQDQKFFDHLPMLFPAYDAKSMFASNAALAEVTALRNSSLQGAYIMLAARALGLDVGPMSGFDNAKVDEAFFKGTTWKSNFICNVGYGEPSKLYPRGPRLDFDVAAKIL